MRGKKTTTMTAPENIHFRVQKIHLLVNDVNRSKSVFFILSIFFLLFLLLKSEGAHCYRTAFTIFFNVLCPMPMVVFWLFIGYTYNSANRKYTESYSNNNNLFKQIHSPVTLLNVLCQAGMKKAHEKKKNVNEHTER